MNIKDIAPFASAYNNYRYLWSPRPETKTTPSTLGKFDDGSFIAQPKFNGANTLLFMNDAGEVKVMNRHNEDKSKDIKLDYAAMYRGTGWYVLNGEFMEKSKKDENGNNFNGNFIIFDVLVYNGFVLSGSTCGNRILLLETLYGSNSVRVTDKKLIGNDYLYFTEIPKVYRPVSYEHGFYEMYGHLAKIDMIEGVVLKKRDGKLAPPFSPTANKQWQLKSRKETKNYNH